MQGNDAQIRSQLAQLEAIYRDAPVGLCFVDTELRYRRINDRLAAMNGRPAEAHLGRTIREVLPEVADVIEPLVRRALAGEAIREVRSDHAGRTFSLSYHPVVDDRGAVIGVSAVIQETTERTREQERTRDELVRRTRAEEALRASEERYRAFIANTSEGVWRFEVEPPIPITIPEDEQIEMLFERAWLAECNDAMAAMYGFTSASELVGARAGDLLVRSDPRNVEYLRAFIRSGYRLHDAESHELDRSGRTKYFVNSLVGFVEGGAVVRAWGVQRDVTERKAWEVALRESEERFRLAVEATNLGMWDFDPATGMIRLSDMARVVVDPKGRTSTGPESARVMAEGGAAIGMRAFMERLHPEDRPKVDAAIRASMDPAGDGVYRAEYRLRLATGEERWISAAGRTWFEGEGEDTRPVRVIGTVRDVTERKRAEAERRQLLDAERAARSEAERVSRLKDEFLATLSHELRTPLTAILGWAQLLQKKSGTDPLVAQGLSVIERNARAQAQMVSDLLDMSRVISGKLRLDAALVDLASVVDGAIESARLAAEAKGIRLEKAVDPGAGAVIGDAGRLAQVVWNLLSNAIKFTPSGGAVHVALEKTGRGVEIRVRDTGQGIKPEFLPHIFERFRQADASTTRRYGGLGLGLSLVKQLVELHGGTVEADSAGEGQGATFCIVFPPHAALPAPLDAAPPSHDGGASAGEGAAPPAAPEPATLRGVRVLVVDDQPDTLDLVRRVLEDHEAEVTTACSASEAFDLLRRARPAVLVSDLGMPDEDGYDLIRRVRALPADEGGATPAAALSALARPEDQDRARLAGYGLHVAKPVEPAELVIAVAQLARAARGARVQHD